MIEAITYTSIVILIIIVIYQKLTIWGLESEVESKKHWIEYLCKQKEFPKVDFEYKKQNICQNLVSELENQPPLRKEFIDSISGANNQLKEKPTSEEVRKKFYNDNADMLISDEYVSKLLGIDIALANELVKFSDAKTIRHKKCFGDGKRMLNEFLLSNPSYKLEVNG